MAVMTVNWASYDSTYKNQQVSTFVGTGFVVTNAASTEIDGLEVDVQWQATDHLKLGAKLALNDGHMETMLVQAVPPHKLSSDLKRGQRYLCQAVRQLTVCS